jgi:hypothetical protein
MSCSSTPASQAIGVLRGDTSPNTCIKNVDVADRVATPHRLLNNGAKFAPAAKAGKGAGFKVTGWECSAWVAGEGIFCSGSCGLIGKSSTIRCCETLECNSRVKLRRCALQAMAKPRKRIASATWPAGLSPGTLSICCGIRVPVSTQTLRSSALASCNRCDHECPSPRCNGSMQCILMSAGCQEAVRTCT